MERSRALFQSTDISEKKPTVNLLTLGKSDFAGTIFSFFDLGSKLERSEFKNKMI